MFKFFSDNYDKFIVFSFYLYIHLTFIAGFIKNAIHVYYTPGTFHGCLYHVCFLLKIYDIK